jgi:hypothetical protein
MQPPWSLSRFGLSSDLRLGHRANHTSEKADTNIQKTLRREEKTPLVHAASIVGNRSKALVPSEEWQRAEYIAQFSRTSKRC